MTATETVTFEWSREHGDCYDCGRPAAFTDGTGIYCAVCAINHAVDGDPIQRIDSESVYVTTLTEKTTDVTIHLVNRVWECECGSQSFRYEESHPSTRELETNAEDGLTFFSTFDWYEGDDSPGVVCDVCNGHVRVPPECTVDFV